jgi:uncharacterized membrane protein YcaP (DUF421 family)
MDWFEIGLRAVIVFLGLLIWARILGKKLISQMTFFDFVAGVAIGSIGGSIMFNTNITVVQGIWGLSVFVVCVLLVDFLVLKNYRSRIIIESQPIIVIKNGEILEQKMAKVRLTMDDLMMLLRKKNVFYVDEVDTAYFETDGTLTVLKKTEYMAATRKDLNLFPASRGRAENFIMDGQILEDKLSSMGKDEDWVKSILQANGVTDIKRVAFAQIDELNQVYIDKRDNPVQ